MRVCVCVDVGERMRLSMGVRVCNRGKAGSRWQSVAGRRLCCCMIQAARLHGSLRSSRMALPRSAQPAA
jgi:hypothetical protein